MKIAILDDWQIVASELVDWSELQQRAEVHFFHQSLRSEVELINTLSSFDVIVPMRERSRFPKAVLSALPRLKFFALTGATTDHINIETCQARGIPLAWSGSYVPSETAEFTFGLILAAERGIADAHQQMRKGNFQENTRLGRRLSELTLGLVGFGNIGQHVARLGVAFGMRVLSWSPSLAAGTKPSGDTQIVTFEEVLNQSDVLSLHVKLNDQTRGMIGANELARMKSGGLLVNTSRGQLVDEQALIAELNSGRIRAALDVYDVEPMPVDHPLRQAPGTVLTPHLGFSTTSCMEEFYRESMENILAWMDGNPIRLLS